MMKRTLLASVTVIGLGVASCATPVTETRSEQMPLHVVDAQERELSGPCGGLGERETDQQSTDQSWALSSSHSVQLIGVNASLLQRSVCKRTDRLHVSAGRDLRHHPSELGVRVDLRRKNVGQRLVSPHDRHGCLVAAGLERQHRGGRHETLLLILLSLSM